MRKIKVCAGIGDNIWLFQKLVNSGESFEFIIAGDDPKRSMPVFDLLGGNTIKSATYSDSFYSPDALKGAVNGDSFAKLKGEEFYLSANEHLENGERIEMFLPDLPTTFNLQFDTKSYKLMADALVPDKNKPIVGIYCSSYRTLSHWKFWLKNEWFQLAKKLHRLNPSLTFVVIGAEFDTDLATDVEKALLEDGLPCLKIIGYPLGIAIEVIKKFDYFFAFPSGLPILSTCLGIPTTMFYPEHLEKMMYAWADPALIEDSTYVGLPFCDVDFALKHSSVMEKLLNRK